MWVDFAVSEDNMVLFRKIVPDRFDFAYCNSLPMDNSEPLDQIHTLDYRVIEINNVLTWCCLFNIN